MYNDSILVNNIIDSIYQEEECHDIREKISL